jgi:hypothetical protein
VTRLLFSFAEYLAACREDEGEEKGFGLRRPKSATADEGRRISQRYLGALLRGASFRVIRHRRFVWTL